MKNKHLLLGMSFLLATVTLFVGSLTLTHQVAAEGHTQTKEVTFASFSTPDSQAQGPNLITPTGFTRTFPSLPAPASQLLSDPAILTAKSQANATRLTFALSPDAAARQVTGEISDPFAIFEPYHVYTTGAPAKAVGIGDFNGDGYNDVALTTGWPANLLHIFTQTLTGTLSMPVSYPAGAAPNALAVGDLNSDGKADVVIASALDDSINVFLQLPGGLLAPGGSYGAADEPNAIAIGDLNGDGRDDLVVSHESEGAIGVFLQTVIGTLAPMTSYDAPLAGWDDIDVGDLNGDDLNDVIKMNGQFPAHPNLSVYLQNQGGFLDMAVPYDLGEPVGNGLAVGEVTGDGLMDVVLSHGGNRPFSHLTVFSQTITGTLGVTRTYPAFDSPGPVEIADVNADGRNDALVLHNGWSNLSVFLQNQWGALSPYQQYDLPVPGGQHYGPQALAVGDINADGLPDVAIADDLIGLVILLHRPPIYHFYFPFAVAPIPETETPITDDFSNPESGWPKIESSLADFIYLDGEYRIFSKREFVSAFATAGHRLIDADASVSARRIGDAQGGYGLAFGYKEVIPVTEYYAFIVWPDFQEWNLIRFRFGFGFETLFWGVDSRIQTGEGVNRLRTVRQGDNLIFWVNEAQVLGAHYPTYTGSRLIGLIQFPLDVGFDARFDDYQLSIP